MNKLEPTIPRRTLKWRDFLAEAKRMGLTKEQARVAWLEPTRGDHFANDVYQVLVLKNEAHGFGEGVEVWWLSIKRHDREPICDWRDLQEIKNQICGPEAEGLMLYPAESRCVDTANQYHLHVFMTPGARIPCGWTTGCKDDSISLGGSKQRKFNHA